MGSIYKLLAIASTVPTSMKSYAKTSLRRFVVHASYLDLLQDLQRQVEPLSQEQARAKFYQTTVAIRGVVLADRSISEPPTDLMNLAPEIWREKQQAYERAQTRVNLAKNLIAKIVD